MVRFALIVMTLALAGCASDGGPVSRFKDPIPDWQMRNIAGQHETAPAIVTDTGADGPVGVVQGSRGKTQIYDGSGSIAPPHPGVTYTSSGQISLDFQDVDAKEAAKAVLDDVLKQTYVIDPKVEGKVSFRSGRPIEAGQALRLLESGLNQVGAVLIVRDRVHYVVPKGKGLPDGPNAIVPSGRGAVAGFSSRAVQLRHIAATEMAEILKPVVKDGGIVRVDNARNLLVLAGTGTDHDAWLDTIRTFDVDWLANRSVGVFKIVSMPAEAMTRSLNEILRNENVDQQLVRFIAVDAGNSVLAVAKTPDALKAARQWVQRLEAAGGQRLQLFHYQMKYAQAGQVLPIISKIFGVASASDTEISSITGRTGGTSSAGRSSRNGSSSSSLSPTSSSNSAQAQQAQQAQAQAAAAAAAAQAAIPPQSLTGARTALAGGAAGAGAAGTEGQMPNSMRLMANEPTNTLLIYATEQDFERVRNVLRTIDVPPRQVLVEATIVEVSLTDELRYGVQYFLQSNIKGLPIDVALTNGNFSGVQPQAPGFGLSLASPAKAVIDALNDVTRVNVVSTPNVMVLNNSVARLVVGDQVPIATQSSQDPLQGNQVVVNTIELRDTGVIFEVTPRINSSGSVLLEITQEVSTVKQQANASLTPTISQRKLSSSVTVENGETIVLGGLFSNQGTVGRAGLPGLSSLPVIGGAFGRTTDNTSRTELIVLISPKIINDKFEARHATNEMRRRIQELRYEDAKVFSKPLLAPDVIVETPAIAVETSPLPPIDVPTRTECNDPCAPLTTSSIKRTGSATPWAPVTSTPLPPPSQPPQRRPKAAAAPAAPHAGLRRSLAD